MIQSSYYRCKGGYLECSWKKVKLYQIIQLKGRGLNLDI